jgi:hypothetical protein
MPTMRKMLSIKLKAMELILGTHFIQLQYKYVWVGGCDDYYTTYERAKEHYDEWIEQGYDGVHLLKIGEEK